MAEQTAGEQLDQMAAQYGMGVGAKDQTFKKAAVQDENKSARDQLDQMAAQYAEAPEAKPPVIADPTTVDQAVQNTQTLESGKIDVPDEQPAPGGIGKYIKDVAKGDIVKGMGHEGLKELETAANAALDAADHFGLHLEQLGIPKNINIVDRLFPDPETTAEWQGRQITKFVAPLALVGELKLGAGLVGAVKNIGTASAITSLVTDPGEKRLSDWVQSMPGVANSVTEYLSSKGTDSKLESRVKNFIEATIADTGITAAMHFAPAAFNLLKTYKARRMAQNVVDKVGVEGEANLSFGKGQEEFSKAQQTAQKYYEKPPKDMEELVSRFTQDNIPITADNLHEVARRGKVSDKVSRQLAKNIQKTDGEIDNLINSKFGTNFSDEQKYALKLEYQKRQLEVLNMTQGQKFSDMSAFEKQAFRERLTDLEVLDARIRAGASESGRALRGEQRAVTGAGKNALTEMNEYQNLFGGQNTLQDTFNAFRKIGESEFSLTKGLEHRAKTYGGKISDSMYEYWVNNILSGPSTLLETNIFSNAGMLGMNTAEAGLREFYGRVFKRGAYDGDAGSLLFGFQDAMGEAWTTAKSVWKGEMPGPGSKFATPKRSSITAENYNLDPTSAMGKVFDVGGKAINWPTRMLSAQDAFFNTLLRRGRLNQLAHRQVLSEGVEFGSKEYNVALHTLKTEPTPGMLKEADRYALEGTLNTPLGKGQFAGEQMAALQDFILKVPTGRYWAPFIRIATNQADAVIQRTPFAVIRGQTRKALMAGGPMREEAIAKMVFGSSVIGVGGTLGAAGILTGHGPSDPKAKAAWLKNGNSEYSLKLGDINVPLRSLGPFALLLNIGADLSEMIGRNDDENAHLDTQLLVGGSELLMHYFTPQFLQENVPDFFGMIQSAAAGKTSADAFSEEVAKFSTGFIPASGAVKALGSFIDPEKRDTAYEKDRGVALNTWEEMRNQWSEATGISKGLPSVVNIFGHDVVAPRNTVSSLISPIIHGVDKQSFAIKEVTRLQMSDPYLNIKSEDNVDESLNLYMPSRVTKKGINGIVVPYKYSPEEYSMLVKLAAGLEVNGQKVPFPQTLEESINDFENDQNYLQSSDTLKKIMIKDKVKMYRTWASQIMATRQDAVEELNLKRTKKLNMLTAPADKTPFGR